MNRHLFRSPAALLPALAALALIAAFARGSLPGAGAARVGSGWALLAALFLAAAYLLRKHMHRRGYSPEFRLRVPIEALERAQVRLAALRRDVARGAFSGARAVSAAARQVLRQEGVQRVYAVRVRPGAAGEPPFVLSTEKTFPLLHSSRWMSGHLYLGTTFALLLLLHGGFSPDSALGWALLALGALIVASGAWGIVQWLRGPARLTKLERDLSIEEAFALEEHLGRKFEGELATFEGELARGLRGLAGGPVDRERARALLASQALAGAERARLEDALVLAAQRARVRQELALLSRARLAMHAWRVAHLPAVVLLVFLVGLHLFALWRY